MHKRLLPNIIAMYDLHEKVGIMSKPPIKIKKTSRRYRLVRFFSSEAVEPQTLRQLNFQLIRITLTILCVVGVMMVFIPVLVSPIYDHYWPGNQYFHRLHVTKWPELISATLYIIVPLLVLVGFYMVYRLICWVRGHLPASRELELID